MKTFLGNISWKAWHVWRRDRDVYMATWKTNFIPPLLEPILYILAFGAGLGALVDGVQFMGKTISYITFIAPGLIAIDMMFQSFYENTYGSFVRMYYQKTFDAIVATPLMVEDVIAGELLWGATKSLVGSIIMLAVISAFGYATYPSSLLIIPYSFLAGLLFSSIAICFTGIVPSIDTFNLPVFLFITPMFLFSGTFFPIELLPDWAQKVALLLPLTHVVNFSRASFLGAFSARVWMGLAGVAVATLFFFCLGIYLMKRRLIR
ncbi:MAG: ABC transporter permease [Acidobacteriota bacterium]